MTDRVKVLGYRLAPVVADISQMFCKVSTKGLGRLANARLRDCLTSDDKRDIADGFGSSSLS